MSNDQTQIFKNHPKIFIEQSARKNDDYDYFSISRGVFDEKAICVAIRKDHPDIQAALQDYVEKFLKENET